MNVCFCVKIATETIISSCMCNKIVAPNLRLTSISQFYVTQLRFIKKMFGWFSWSQGMELTVILMKFETLKPDLKPWSPTWNLEAWLETLKPWNLEAWPSTCNIWTETDQVDSNSNCCFWNGYWVRVLFSVWDDVCTSGSRISHSDTWFSQFHWKK